MFTLHLNCGSQAWVTNGHTRPGTQVPADELFHRLHLVSFRPQMKSRSGQTPAWGFACTDMTCRLPTQFDGRGAGQIS